MRALPISFRVVPIANFSDHAIKLLLPFVYLDDYRGVRDRDDPPGFYGGVNFASPSS